MALRGESTVAPRWWQRRIAGTDAQDAIPTFASRGPTLPLRLNGFRSCGAVQFSLDSHTPRPSQLCSRWMCRKTAGGGGYAINIMGVTGSLDVRGRKAVAVYRADVPGPAKALSRGPGSATSAATAPWLYHETWPGLIHPFASAIGTPLPTPPSQVHIILACKPGWVQPSIGGGDSCFDRYPDESIEDWHKSREFWID